MLPTLLDLIACAAPRSSLRTPWRWLLVASCGVSLAAAQCGLQWLPGQLPGTDGTVHTLVPWDRDGAGPLPPLVVMGGSFRAVGQLPASRVAAYDPATGQSTSLGTGVDGDVRCAAVLSNGDLVVGGSFTLAGGNAAACLARWDGVAWSALAGGITGGVGAYVDALAVAPNGDLVVGGSFASAGGVPAALVARWNGVAWSALGAGLVGVAVNALTHLPDGSLVAGGTFWQAGGLAVDNVARFDGAAWSPLGSGLRFLSNSPPAVQALQVLGNGHLVAGGAFDASGTTAALCVAEWDGTTWSPLGAGLSVVQALTLVSGQLVAIAPVGIAGWGLTRWNGVSWTNLAPGVGLATCLTALPNGEILVGGTFLSVGGVSMHNVARWNGSSWNAAVSAAVTLAPLAHLLLAMSNGDLVAANLAQSPSLVARRSGLHWSPLPGLTTSLSSPPFPALLAERANGDLMLFASSTGLLRWSGSSWVSMGTPSSVVLPRALLSLPDGSLLVAGFFGGGSGPTVMRWDGAAWTPWLTGPTVMALGRLPNGDIVAGGSFLSIGGVAAARVARFDGSQWHPLGGGVDNVVWSLTTCADGSVVVAGDFATAGGTPAPRIARWSGSAWSGFGAGMVPARLASLPDGEVVAVGDLTIGGVTRTGQLARSVGQQWVTFAPGLNGQASDVVVLPNGTVAVAGNFTNAGGFGSAYVAELASPCAATAVAYGNRCSGSAGPVDLQAVQLPWLGGTCRSRGVGIASNGIAFGVIGWSATSTPLGTFHPAAGVGCTALVSPDAVVWLPVQAGIAHWSFAVPNAPALVGVMLREQVLHAEIGPLGDLVRLSSSNGIELTVGAL